MKDLLRGLLILSSGLAAAVVFVLPLKLLGNEPQGIVTALAVAAYSVVGIAAVGGVSLLVAARLRVDR